MNKKETEVGCIPATMAIATILVLVVISSAAVIAVATLPFMWAWGLFVTPVFGLPLLSFAEGFGAMAILGIVSVFFKFTVKRTVGE